MVAMSQLDGANPQTDPVVLIADFKSLPTTAPELTAFTGIPTGQYTSFGFETPAPDDGASNFNDVPQEDFDAMLDNDWSCIIEGTITRVSDEASKDFLIEADVPTVYSDCAVDGMQPGVNVSSNSSVDITLHGDHLFFNGLAMAILGPAVERVFTRAHFWLIFAAGGVASAVASQAWRQATLPDTISPNGFSGVSSHLSSHSQGDCSGFETDTARQPMFSKPMPSEIERVAIRKMNNLSSRAIPCPGQNQVSLSSGKNDRGVPLSVRQQNSIDAVDGSYPD